MVDNWDYGDGEISRCYALDFFYADSTSILAGSTVKFGSAGANKCPVTVTAGVGDGFGVALKTPVAVGDMIPVLIIGVYKFLGGNTKPTIGLGVVNSYMSTTVPDYVVLSKPSAYTNYAAFGGASYILGIALQTCATYGDEILILVGRSA